MTTTTATPPAHAPLTHSAERAASLSSEDVLSVVGWRRAEHYNRVWSHGPAGRVVFGFVLGALVFGCGWLLYRKMYREFLLALGVRLVATVVLVAAGLDRAGFFIADGVVAVGLALAGASLYRRHALHLVAAASAAWPDPAQRRAWLDARGGVNWWAFLAYAAASATVAASIR